MHDSRTSPYASTQDARDFQSPYQANPTRLADLRWRIGLLHLVALAAALHIAVMPSHHGWGVWLGIALLGLSFLMWMLELADDAANWSFARTLGVLLPCTRMPVRSGDEKKVYFPERGWVLTGHNLEKSLEASFAGPMILAALAIIPLLALEFWGSEYLKSHPWIEFAVAAAHGCIWAAFAFELIIRCNVAPSKWAYIRSHWLDALIVMMPIFSVAFLRIARLGQLARLNQTTRLFRLNGVMMKAWRSVILIDVLARLLDRECDRKAIRMQQDRGNILRQLDRIDTELARVEARSWSA